MKILARPIEVATIMSEVGTITPIKFRLKNNDETCQVIKIDRVLFFEKEKLAGNVMYVYRCRSIIDGVEKVYEIKYELGTCKWMLWKM